MVIRTVGDAFLTQVLAGEQLKRGSQISDSSSQIDFLGAV
jgi:hypothetical protein